MTMNKGDCVLTTYGVGVVTDVEPESKMFEALLWRIPGQSIASCALGRLREDTVQQSLPAAPGMITNVSKEDGSMEKMLLLAYLPATAMYLATPFKGSIAELAGVSTDITSAISNTDFIQSVAPSQVQKSPSAKFYPLLQNLMSRGDRAAKSTASLVTAHTATLYQKSNEFLSAVTDPSLQVETSKKVEEVSDQATKVFKTALGEFQKPDSAQVQEVVSMLKDEELTTLLEKGRDRLRQLMTSDIPQATEKAMGEMGITFAPSGSSSSISETNTMILSREKALDALDELLLQHANVNVDELRAQMETQFSTMFDSLAEAARSDERLTSIFDSITERTAEWQEMSGRVMASKSASIFFEGAQRLQARAATIFSAEQLKWAKESSLKLTKGFTEGDAALARLKSIELGDAVRKRLFAAIELRSGSEGGLDGIIAGALTQMDAAASSATGEVSQSNVQVMLASLQKSASSTAQNAHETLLATLARKSQYRDLAVFKIEEAFVSMEEYLGDEMTAEEIAQLASGEGGTAAIFDPIAKRAAKEINKQLDLAEKTVEDPVVLTVLQHVRKIVSGDLSLGALTDEVVSILNDDTSVAAGERLVMQGERLLDAIENATKNQYLNDVIGVVEKAGLTKDEVIKQLESLSMNNIVDVAESAVSDEKARKQILSKAADSALDFLLRILPSMPVPPFNGVKDGLIYHLSNLSMEGFKVKKENILVEIAGIRATKDKNANATLIESQETEEEFLKGEEEKKHVRATELLIIDVRDISALLEDAIWSFEQTYFPYLKGEGKAFAQLWEGSIRLQFELRKQKSDLDPQKELWEPVLCLHEHSVCIRELELKLLGQGKIVWVLNKLSSMLKSPLCSFVTRSVQTTLGNGSGLLLERLNEVLRPYWPIVLRTAGLEMDDLQEVTHTDVVKAAIEINSDEVELVWRERLPLGMNLLMNDDSGLIKVVEFPRGSQARSVVDQIGLNPDSFKGATITAVNGVRFGEDDQDDLIDALKDPGRPKAVTFLLTDPAEAERIRLFCSALDESRTTSDSEAANDEEVSVDTVNKFELHEEGPIGIQFSNAPDDFCLVVEGFTRDDNGKMLQAERCALVDAGDNLVSINSTVVLGSNGSGRTRALELFKEIGAKRPLTLGFAKPFTTHLELSKEDLFAGNADIAPTDEFVFKEKQNESGKKEVIVDGFKEVAGAVERSKVFLGDQLIHVNGESIGPAARELGATALTIEEVRAMVENEQLYPITLVFARFQATSRWYGAQNDIKNAHKVAVTVEVPEDLGIEFDKGSNTGEVIVKKFLAVKGPIRRRLHQIGQNRKWIGLVVDSINGESVPSFANAEMVERAFDHSWEKTGRVTACFCDEKRKQWLRSLAPDS